MAGARKFILWILKFIESFQDVKIVKNNILLLNTFYDFIIFIMDKRMLNINKYN